MSKLITLPPKPGMAASTGTAPPSHFEDIEKSLWRDVTGKFGFDAASLALLSTSLDAHARARNCRDRIDIDGPVTADRWGQLRPHPLLPAEAQARAAFLAGWKSLGLNIGGSK